MKAIKITLLLICVIFCITKATAQTSHYTTTRTFQLEDGATLRAYVDEYYETITIYNINNPFEHQEQTLRDGSPLPIEFLHPRRMSGPLMNSNVYEWFGMSEVDMIVNIVTAFLCSDEQARVGSDILGIDVYVDPQNKNFQSSSPFTHNHWQPVGISFVFDIDSPWATIPIETFRQIEVHLMKILFYTPTEKGMQLNFIRSVFSVDIVRGRA